MAAIPPRSIVRLHPLGGYAVTQAEDGDWQERVSEEDQQFGTVLRAILWISHVRPGDAIEVAEECERDEAQYRLEVSEFARMLNGARAILDAHPDELDSAAVELLRALLFPDRTSRSGGGAGWPPRAEAGERVVLGPLRLISDDESATRQSHAGDRTEFGEQVDS